MILGYFKRKRAEREELDELRAFAEDMDGVLDNLAMLMDLADEEQVPIELRGLWRAKYVEGAWDQTNGWPIELPVLDKVDVTLPAPKLFEPKMHRSEMHRSHILSFDTMVSDKDLLIRRTAEDRASLVGRIRGLIDEHLDDLVKYGCTNPKENSCMRVVL